MYKILFVVIYVLIISFFSIPEVNGVLVGWYNKNMVIFEYKVASAWLSPDSDTKTFLHSNHR